jgi:stage V sporulation protein M
MVSFFVVGLSGTQVGGGGFMKFYTIKLPKFLGGFIRAILGSFRKG